MALKNDEYCEKQCRNLVENCEKVCWRTEQGKEFRFREMVSDAAEKRGFEAHYLPKENRITITREKKSVFEFNDLSMHCNDEVREIFCTVAHFVRRLKNNKEVKK